MTIFQPQTHVVRTATPCSAMISGLRRLTNDTDQLQNVRAVDGNTAPTAPKEVAVLLGLSGTEVLNRCARKLGDEFGSIGRALSALRKSFVPHMPGEGL